MFTSVSECEQTAEAGRVDLGICRTVFGLPETLLAPYLSPTGQGYLPTTSPDSHPVCGHLDQSRGQLFAGLSI